MNNNAESLMTNRFMRISTAHTLREALGLILYGEERNMDTGAIVVINPEGEYAGLLTPEYLVRGFIDSGQAETALTHQGFLEGVDRHLPDTVDVVMEKELPRLSRDSSLLEMIQSLGQGEYECLPVLDDKRVVGLVYVTEVFKEVARLALTPGQEGINLDH